MTPSPPCGNPNLVCDLRLTDPLLKVLLNALRPDIEQDLGQPVLFVVRTMRVQGNWAFAIVRPQTRSGGKIDYLKTHHADRVRSGIFDGNDVQALLFKAKDRWVVKEFAVAPTDVPYPSWPDRFGAPGRLFDMKAD